MFDCGWNWVSRAKRYVWVIDFECGCMMRYHLRRKEPRELQRQCARHYEPANSV